MLCLTQASPCSPFQDKEEGRKEEREGKEGGRGRNFTIKSKQALTTVRNKGYFCIK